MESVSKKADTLLTFEFIKHNPRALTDPGPQGINNIAVHCMPILETQPSTLNLNPKPSKIDPRPQSVTNIYGLALRSSQNLNPQTLKPKTLNALPLNPTP